MAAVQGCGTELQFVIEAPYCSIDVYGCGASLASTLAWLPRKAGLYG
jgi:hypothetical protein